MIRSEVVAGSVGEDGKEIIVIDSSSFSSSVQYSMTSRSIVLASSFEVIDESNHKFFCDTGLQEYNCQKLPVLLILHPLTRTWILQHALTTAFATLVLPAVPHGRTKYFGTRV